MSSGPVSSRDWRLVIGELRLAIGHTKLQIADWTPRTRATDIMHRSLFALIVGLGFMPPAADNYPKNPNIDVLNYRFGVTLSDASDEIKGEATITAAFLIDGITELRLDLIKESTARNGFGMTVSAVSLDGKALDFRHANDVLLIALPSPSEAGERRTLTIAPMDHR